MRRHGNYINIIESLKKEEVTLLMGTRQIGKTTLTKEIITKLNEQGKQVLYLNMEKEVDASVLRSQQRFINKLRLEFGHNAGYVFIDEIQHKEDAAQFLKSLHDLKLPYKFVVIGSGSIALKESSNEKLHGKKHVLYLDALDLHEFLDYKTDCYKKDRLVSYSGLDSEKLTLYLEEYLNFGGYPNVISSTGKAEKIEVMDDIYHAYLTKDISYLMGVRSPKKYEKMLHLLAVQNGAFINYTQLAADIDISVDTLKNYIWYAEQTFVISMVKPFFTNARKELTKAAKVYFNDLGFLNYARGLFGRVTRDNDFVFRNMIFNLLNTQFRNKNVQLQYWRTKDKAEVDFVIHQGKYIIPFVVKHSHLKKSTISRALRSFIKKYSPEEAYVINLSREDEIMVNDTKVLFIPYWKLIFE